MSEVRITPPRVFDQRQLVFDDRDIRAFSVYSHPVDVPCELAHPERAAKCGSTHRRPGPFTVLSLVFAADDKPTWREPERKDDEV